MPFDSGTWPWYSHEEFQPSPNLTAGCHFDQRIECDQVGCVSTLTQPHGWVPCVPTRPGPRPSKFQPSPNLTAGCHLHALQVIGHAVGVSTLTQPHGWVPYQIFTYRRPSTYVSTLTQPHGWVPWLEVPRLGQLVDVSTLTQPHGWVPYSVPRARPGETRVSTLTQPHGWVPFFLSGWFREDTNVSTLTQPHGWVPYPMASCLPAVNPLFQPSPNLTAGCHSTYFLLVGSSIGFNPHPTSRLGAITRSPRRGHRNHKFQPSPNLTAGCHAPFGLKIWHHGVFVSTLTQPHGWVPSEPISPERQISCFNPHPTSRLGAIRGCSCSARHTSVSTLTQPHGWVPSPRCESRYSLD